MKITILTLFPDMINGFFEESIVKRAQDKKLVEIEVVNLRDFAKNSYGSVDDRPYGGGAGMVMRVDVLHDALKKLHVTGDKLHVVLTSAKGKQFNQKKAQEYSKLDHLVIIAAHYEGVDERVLEYVDEEVSLGDFVMTGGEIAAAAITDSVVRLLENVLKKEEATQEESFFTITVKYLTVIVGEHEVLTNLQHKGIEEVQLLEYPHYTRPEEYEGKKVPEVLLGGNHAEIQKWRIKKAFEETLKKRPDLLE
jgi:tRNA (guanine37-N1)-methyltransferase